VTVDAAGRLTEFLDPGMSSSEKVVLGYDLLLRLTSWRSRRGYTTKYGYVAATALLAADTLPQTQAGRAVTSFTPVQAQGLARSESELNTTVPTSAALVVVDGPRPASDVLDVARFRVNAFGAPTMILNPLGDSTNIAYGDARFPLLPTRVRFPNGRIVGMAYDNSSNLEWRADSTHSAGVAIDSFQYDLRWNRVSVATRPTGEFTIYEYDSQTGNLIKIIDAQGNETEVRWYTSGPQLGLVRAIDAPGPEPPDSFAYDTHGNLVLVRDGRGQLWHNDYDDYGNLNFMEDPTGLKTRINFSPLNLDTEAPRVCRRPGYLSGASSGLSALSRQYASSYSTGGI